MRLLQLLFVLSAVSVAAQELPDSGLPDASVGQGGAEQGSEENDPNNVPCVDSNTCANGFQCVNARCVPRPVKNVGCSAVPGVLVLGGLAIAWRRRRA
jgi:hypothetical protein